MLVLALASPFAVANEAAMDLSTLVRIEVQPQRLQLHRPRDRAIVLVTGYFPNGLVVDLTRQAQFTSAAPTIAAYQEGAVCPTGNGNCEIDVKVADRKASLPVVVDGFDRTGADLISNRDRRGADATGLQFGRVSWFAQR